ncbi:MAG: hypothetical protein KA190_30510, partial [Kofleriaceae bacterium]|nr:hypothetical protein [Kofleriaceae bacterium]
MLDGLGSLRLRRRDAHHVELTLSPLTGLLGGGVGLLGLLVVAWLAPLSWVLALVPGAVAAAGVATATLRRRLVFDRDDGVLRVEQHVLGFASRATIPLFHLRAVVVKAHPGALGQPRFVAYLERRVGQPIHLEESRRIAPLL